MGSTVGWSVAIVKAADFILRVTQVRAVINNQAKAKLCLAYALLISHSLQVQLREVAAA